MKKFLISLILFLLLITQSCVTTKVEKILLPPKPQRAEQKVVQSVSDLAEVINYYEHLVQEWEQWGKDVEKLIE